jgi:hypothetical protein
MEATRMRFGAFLEWLLAAAFTAAAVIGGSTMLREVQAVRPVVAVMAGEPRVDEAHDGIPPGSVSIPLLLLEHGRVVRVGDLAPDVTARLGKASHVISESLDSATERVTRFYSDGGLQFIVVFQGLDLNAAARVAAIYLL